MQFLALSLLVCSSLAAPAADAEADPQFGFPGPLTVPAPNCVTTNEILVTQACTPRAENICETQVVETEEIEYEKVCKDVVDVICDGKTIIIIVSSKSSVTTPQPPPPTLPTVRGRLSPRPRLMLSSWDIQPTLWPTL